MTTETALQKSWICKICATTKTRAGICRSCSNELGFTEEISLEATVRASFEYFFPGISTNKNIFLGGRGCADCPTENSHVEDKSNRFKGAYVDVPIITEDVRINIEVDENAHRYYDPNCELARYDTVTFGTDEKVLKQNWVLRFNPHNAGEIKLELVDRIKIIIEYVLRILSTIPDADSRIGCNVVYFFYGTAGSDHQAAAERATSTLILHAAVNDVKDIGQSRPEVNSFELSMVESVRKQQVDLLEIKRINIEEGQCCQAINHAENPSKRKRCSGAPQKRSKLCARHNTG